MKKLFFVFSAFVAMAMCACGGKTEAASTNDSDSVSVDTVLVDTLDVDTICFD